MKLLSKNNTLKWHNKIPSLVIACLFFFFGGVRLLRYVKKHESNMLKVKWSKLCSYFACKRWMIHKSAILQLKKKGVVRILFQQFAFSLPSIVKEHGKLKIM